MKDDGTPSAVPASSSLAPLRERLFAVLWVATVVGNTGRFVREVASGWVVTELTLSPVAVAMVQAAATLPVFLLAIPAGALADTLNPRKFLIGIQLLLVGASSSLMWLSAAGVLTVTSLVLLTFCGGVGAALMGPTWQVIVPELVGTRNLRSAVTLNSLGINIARAIGPALAGLVLASIGVASAYGVDVISCAFVLGAVLWWRRPVTTEDALSEGFGGALRAGLRYVRASRDLHVVLLRTLLFFMSASCLWALLPLVARNVLGGGAGLYGVMLAAVGVGALGGAMLMSKLREQLSSDKLLLAASWTTAVVMAFLSLAPPQWAAVASLLALGVAWICALTTLNGVTQSILPNWVRGRSLAVYLTVFNGAMAAGSLAWGTVAHHSSTPFTLMVGAGSLVLVSLLAHRVKLPRVDADLVPSNRWPEPLTAMPVALDRGPVLVHIEYRVEPVDRSAFLRVLSRLSVQRRRDGAYAWGIAEDSANPGLLLEWFRVESWAEHLRQHRRATKADVEAQEEVLRFHRGTQRPIVRHFLALDGQVESRTV